MQDSTQTEKPNDDPLFELEFNNCYKGIVQISNPVPKYSKVTTFEGFVEISAN